MSRTASLLLLLLVCNTAAAEFTDRGVVHTVYLWLKNPANQQERERLLIATDRLRTIPGVREIRFGEVIESSRNIVDDSFDVGIYFYFSDVAAMNQYLVHPLHREVVEQDIKPVVERIVVHDFRDTKTR
ncbi:MAG: Dabb family protein [Gammaproteobacteria bacterium]|jgi:cell division protein FtsX